jgi:hypothetical protein
MLFEPNLIFFEAAGEVEQVGFSLKLNHHRKIKFA